MWALLQKIYTCMISLNMTYFFLKSNSVVTFIKVLSILCSHKHKPEKNTFNWSLYFNTTLNCYSYCSWNIHKRYIMTNVDQCREKDDKKVAMKVEWRNQRLVRQVEVVFYQWRSRLFGITYLVRIDSNLFDLKSSRNKLIN